MRFPAVFKPASVLACMLLTGLLSACSTSPDSQGKETLTVTAGGTDEATARANAMDTGHQLCLSRGGRQASMVDMQTTTPPPVATMNDKPGASSTTDALEASTTEGDLWRATLVLRCH